jgi:asparagine synthetase B (glutamine-hydrolysing)
LGVRDLPTFTIGLPYKQFDEAPHARNVAQRYHTRHHELTIRPSLKGLLPDLVWHLDEPSDPLSLCAYHVARLARQHVKVVIGGDGGDELFGGYDPRPDGTRAWDISCAGCTACPSSRVASAMPRACRTSTSTTSAA